MQAFTVTEITGADAVPVLREYLRRWKWEVGQFFGWHRARLDRRAALAIVGDHPVFEVIIK